MDRRLFQERKEIGVSLKVQFIIFINLSYVIHVNVHQMEWKETNVACPIFFFFTFKFSAEETIDSSVPLEPTRRSVLKLGEQKSSAEIQFLVSATHLIRCNKVSKEITQNKA